MGADMHVQLIASYAVVLMLCLLAAVTVIAGRLRPV